MSKEILHYQMPNRTPLYVMNEYGDVIELLFCRMDGMYSCCTMEDDKGSTQYAHFHGSMPVEPYKDGFRACGAWDD